MVELGQPAVRPAGAQEGAATGCCACCCAWSKEAGKGAAWSGCWARPGAVEMAGLVGWKGVRNQEEERILGGCEVEMGFRFRIRLGLTKEGLYILGLVWVTG